MTDVDELLARLRKLPPLAPSPELRAHVLALGSARARRKLPPAPLASLAVGAAVIVYLSWAMSFAGALYP